MTLIINFSNKYGKMPFGFQESKLLEELRALVVRLNGDNMAAILGAALEHIHMQDARIAELEAQVAALKKIVIGERSQKIYDEKFGHISISLPDDRDLFLERLKIADDEARDRLVKEYPKVDWK